ncbi:unnamed protein product, partial [Discosporangium mesarthrocarpum]
QVSQWLRWANGGLAALAVSAIGYGSYSITLDSLGAVGWQWTAVITVCLGSLLLLLVLLGSTGARLRNRPTLLLFVSLKLTVSLGTALCGGWCLALAGGGTSVSGLSRVAIEAQLDESVTVDQFVDSARSELIVLGSWCVVLAIYSMAVPCLLAAALLTKLRDEERSRTGEQGGSGGDKGLSGASAAFQGAAQERHRQLCRALHEANGLCCAFALICTGYGGYSLFYTLSLGLTANVTSTYFMLAGGYILLVAGAIGVWAGLSKRVEAFNLLIGTLAPAGLLYVCLAAAFLVDSGRSDSRIAASWDEPAGGEGGIDDPYLDLYPDPNTNSLTKVQRRFKTVLVVAGVLSAITALMVAAVALCALATRRALLEAGQRRPLPRLTHPEALALAWALVMAVLTTLFDGSYVLFSNWLADEERAVWLVGFWRAIGRGDPRYLRGEGFVLATGIVAALVVGPACLLYAWTIVCRRGFRFTVGMLVCVSVVYMQVLSYATWRWPQGWSGGGAAVFWVVFVLWGLLRLAAPLAILWYNMLHLSRRVHAAEVHYRSLLVEHERLKEKTSALLML